MNNQLFRFDGLGHREVDYIDVVDMFATKGMPARQRGGFSNPPLIFIGIRTSFFS